MEPTPLSNKTALITGASRRIGAAIARRLHAAGCDLLLHYRGGELETRALADELNRARPDSAALAQAELLAAEAPMALADAARARWGRLDILINNASSFFPTPLGTVSEQDWDALLGSNLKAPFFLTQALLPELRAARGCVINIADVHAERPRDGYPVYNIAKAGLVMLTKTLAWELRPDVRVNAVAPGAIMWAASESDAEEQDDIVRRIALGRLGAPDDIAAAALYLVSDGSYVTGQTLAVDGGRSLFM